MKSKIYFHMGIVPNLSDKCGADKEEKHVLKCGKFVMNPLLHIFSEDERIITLIMCFIEHFKQDV